MTEDGSAKASGNQGGSPTGRALRLAVFLVAAATGLQGQFSSILEGTITDPAGAVIPGV